MRLSSFLIVGLLALVICSGVVSPSKDVRSKTATLDVVNSADSTSINRKVGRLLRIAGTAGGDRFSEFDGEERVNNYWDDIVNYVFSLIRSKKDNSPPKAGVLPRSNSFPSEKATPSILTRSKSATHEKIDLETAVKIMNDFKKEYKSATYRLFKDFDKEKKDPDMMFDFFGLNPKYAQTTKANKLDLWAAAGGNAERHGEYIVWYKYAKYYKRQHPNWVSKFAEATPA